MFTIPNEMIDALCVHVSIFVGSDERRDFKKRENEVQKIAARDLKHGPMWHG